MQHELVSGSDLLIPFHGKDDPFPRQRFADLMIHFHGKHYLINVLLLMGCC
jgi:hypothetical protein